MGSKAKKSEVTEVRIRRLSVGTIVKICLFVTIPGSALGILFGLFALIGFDTVRWGYHSVVGVNGLLLGAALGLVAGLTVSLANSLLIWMGMAVVSTFKTTRIQFQGATTPKPSTEKIEESRL